MSLRTQSKVLRVLEDQRFEPVGAAESIQVDVRVVAATNKNLEVEIERGNFREDLFYRLNVIPFHVPPLRERKEDIPALAAYFLEEFARAYGRKPKELTPQALEALAAHHWPGNVRELRNLIERIVILNPQSRIDARHIPLQAARKPAHEQTGGAVWQPAGCAGSRRTRIHPAEAGGIERQCEPRRRAAWAWNAATSTARCALWELRLGNNGAAGHLRRCHLADPSRLISKGTWVISTASLSPAAGRGSSTTGSAATVSG